MTRPDIHRRVQPPPHGQIGYLQLPALDVARSAAFYQAVCGWSAGLEHGSFEAPGMIGQWTTDLKPASSAGPVLWICADELWPTLDKVVGNGGTVRGRPQLDNGERWLVEVGNGVLLWFGDVSDFDGVVARAEQLKTTVVRPPHRNPLEGQGNGPGHREIWLRDPDGYTVVVASPDGEAYESPTSAM